MSLSLLLVEDDPAEASRLSSVLAHLGYTVSVAADGDAALARLSCARFDVVLLDLVVPELDGMGVLAEMAARSLDVPVVVQVTPAGMAAAADAIRAGARDFVVKPAGALRLQVALANAAALARAAASDREPRPATAPAPDNVIALPAAQPAASGAGAAYARLDAAGHARRLEQIEAEAIRFACHLYGGQITEVARRLGIGRSTLYRKLASLGETVEGNRETEPSVARIVAAE